MTIIYNNIRPQIESFDIVLFSGEGLISELIQRTTSSIYSHVALAMCLNSWDQILCSESTTLSDTPDLISGMKVKGVQIVPLSARLANYPGRVFYRKIRGPRTDAMKILSSEFMREFQGRPYETNQIELLRSALDWSISPPNQPDGSSVFCSEYNAYHLRRVRILAEDGKPPNEFTPADFARDLNLLEGYTVGEVVEFAR